jgi:hypothetical protein
MTGNTPCRPALALLATGLLLPTALCAAPPPLAARVDYRDAQAGTREQLALEDVQTYYLAGRNTAGQDIEPQRFPALSFRLTPRAATQDVPRISIPFADLTTIDFEWLPPPRSTIAFRSIQCVQNNGSTHTLTMVADGKEYRYVRKNKAGRVEQEVTGHLDLSIPPPAATAAAGGLRDDTMYDWHAFRGMGMTKQRSHAPDNEWVLVREQVDRVEFLAETPAEEK